MSHLPIKKRIRTKSPSSAILFDRRQPLLYTANYEGIVYSWGCEGEDKLLENCLGTYEAFKDETIRFLAHFNENILVVAKSGSLKVVKYDNDANNFSLVWEYVEKVQEVCVSAVHVVNDHVFALGTESGHIYVFDTREKGEKSELKVHDEVVTCIRHLICEKKIYIVSGSFDGFLQIHRLKWLQTKYTLKFLMESDPQLSSYDSILSFTLTSSTIITGTESGSVYIYNLSIPNETIQQRNKFNGHPTSVDFIFKFQIEESQCLLTASFDGLLRLVTIDPFQLLGAFSTNVAHLNLTDTPDDDTYLKLVDQETPIDAICLSRSNSVIAVTHQDDYVTLFGIQEFLDMDEDEVSDERDKKRVKFYEDM